MNTFEHMQTTLIYEQLIVECLKSICHIQPPETFKLTARHTVQVLINFPSTMTKIIAFFPVSKAFSIQPI